MSPSAPGGASSAETQPDSLATSDARPVALELRNVSHEFTAAAGTTSVFEDLSLRVHAGEFLAVVGPSGCGKTTLLRIMNGLQHPTVGEVLVKGAPVGGVGTADVAMVFQQDSLLPWRTVWRNVTFGAEMRRSGRRRPRADREKAQALLRTVGLDDFAGFHPRQLSGGMRQRANLARALYVDPAVLLMDEPFASLDAQTQEEMQAELLRIWSKHRITVVFVTHRLEEAVYLADRVVILSGRPSRIKETIDIRLERPRSLDIKRSSEFNALVDKVTAALRSS